MSHRRSLACPTPPALLIALTALTALSITGASVAAQSSTRNGSSSGGATVTVSGTVYDSLAGRPLPGALVQLVSKGEVVRAWSATTGANGDFSLSEIPAGLYVMGFLHPSLDSLGLGIPPHMLDVSDGLPAHVNLAVPSAATIRKQLCTGLQADDSTGLVLGFIRDADSAKPLAGASMVMSWTELVLDKGIHTDRRDVPVKSNGEGWYAICGVPTDGSVAARAELDGDVSGYIDIDVPPRGLLHRDFSIPTGSAAVAVTSSAERPAGEAVRHGTARLAGTVRDGQGRPLGGAQLMVWGSDISGSTQDDGSFTLSNLPAGTQSLEVRYVSYSPKRVAVELVSNQTRSVTVTLDEHADVLGQVTVYGKTPKRRQDFTGFLERRKTGLGHFLTRAQIAEIRPYQFTDLIRRIPGLKLVPSSYFDYTILSSRVNTMAATCQPQIFIDGARIVDDTGINQMLMPGDVAGIEVYAGTAGVPSQYVAGDCGSILIWTGPDPSRARK